MTYEEVEALYNQHFEFAPCDGCTKGEKKKKMIAALLKAFAAAAGGAAKVILKKNAPAFILFEGFLVELATASEELLKKIKESKQYNIFDE